MRNSEVERAPNSGRGPRVLPACAEETPRHGATATRAAHKLLQHAGLREFPVATQSASEQLGNEGRKDSLRGLMDLFVELSRVPTTSACTGLVCSLLLLATIQTLVVASPIGDPILTTMADLRGGEQQQQQQRQQQPLPPSGNVILGHSTSLRRLGSEHTRRH